MMMVIIITMMMMKMMRAREKPTGLVASWQQACENDK